MEKSLTKTETALVNSEEFAKALKNVQDFQIRLAKPAKKSQIKKNEMIPNLSYIPIGHIESLLDEFFFGLWETKNFQYSHIANELVGSLELVVFHPAAQKWLTRIGAGAVMIQFEAKYETDNEGKPDKKRKIKTDITDIRGKILNTLVKDFPHLKSTCISNAARSLGKVFGRDLNRKEEASYNPMLKILNSDQMALRMELKTYTDFEKLKEDAPNLLIKAKELGFDLYDYINFTDEVNDKYRELKGLDK